MCVNLYHVSQQASERASLTCLSSFISFIIFSRHHSKGCLLLCWAAGDGYLLPYDARISTTSIKYSPTQQQHSSSREGHDGYPISSGVREQFLFFLLLLLAHLFCSSCC